MKEETLNKLGRKRLPSVKEYVGMEAPHKKIVSDYFAKRKTGGDQGTLRGAIAHYQKHMKDD